MNYDRIGRRHLDMVSVKILLVFLKVMFASLEENKFKSNCWNTPSNLQKEKLSSLKQKKCNVKKDY